MRNMIRGVMLVGAAGIAFAAAWGKPPAPLSASDAAAAFGARDNVLDVSISPDGKSLVIVQPNGTRGAIASVVATDGSGASKAILTSSGSPDRLTGCRWITNARLACDIYMIDTFYGDRHAASRIVAINADGTQLKLLSDRGSDRAMGIALYGGEIIDWLPDDDNGSVLMTRVFIPEESTGHIMSQFKEGLGVDRVDAGSLRRTMIEQPNSAASEYITDGHGHVRIMGLAKRNSLGEWGGTTEYRYRKKDSRDWLPLSTVIASNYHETGFDPYAVDPTLDVAYGLETIDGRTALYKVSLDGNLRKEKVFDRPDADIDSLIEIGRSDRVVGARWTTDKGHAEMFDPGLKALAQGLAKALPKSPNVLFVDASADERRLVLYAGSDTDPGTFYLFDKSDHHLSQILPVRPQLSDTVLSAVKPISYPASDGTMVPAYLTLPPGSDGKSLPAIVLPHGGPFARDVWAFDWLPQYFANRGYAVIQPNYRGSSGYGMDWFQNNGIRSWRTAIGDINDAGRWLVKQGIADPGKLAIVGWSYGGYAALQSAVVDPALFKATVAIAPVTDFGIMRNDALNDGDETEKSVDATFGDATNLEQGSPARHADRFVAPVLMFHGKVDETVPIAQSELMRDKLKGAGKQVELIEFEGVDHQIDDSADRKQMLAKIDAFLRSTMHF